MRCASTNNGGVLGVQKTRGLNELTTIVIQNIIIINICMSRKKKYAKSCIIIIYIVHALRRKN